MRRRNSRTRRFSWRQDLTVVGRSTLTEPQSRRGVEPPPPPLVTPCLDNLDLPYADDDPISSTSLADAGGAAGVGLTVKPTSPRRAPASHTSARRSSTRRQSGLARAQSVRRPGRATEQQQILLHNTTTTTATTTTTTRLLRRTEGRIDEHDEKQH